MTVLPRGPPYLSVGSKGHLLGQVLHFLHEVAVLDLVVDFIVSDALNLGLFLLDGCV